MRFEPTEQARSVAARFGRRIRRARYASGLQQRAVAREAGVSQATISRIELGGGARVSLGSWIRVATAVGLDWDFVSPSESHHDRQATQSRCHRLVAAVAAEGGWLSQMLAHPTDPGHTETVLERSERREIANHPLDRETVSQFLDRRRHMTDDVPDAWPCGVSGCRCRMNPG